MVLEVCGVTASEARPAGAGGGGRSARRWGRGAVGVGASERRSGTGGGPIEAAARPPRTPRAPESWAGGSAWGRQGAVGALVGDGARDAPRLAGARVDGGFARPPDEEEDRDTEEDNVVHGRFDRLDDVAGVHLCWSPKREPGSRDCEDRQSDDRQSTNGPKLPIRRAQIGDAVHDLARDRQQFVAHSAQIRLRKSLGDPIAERLDGTGDLRFVELCGTSAFDELGLNRWCRRAQRGQELPFNFDFGNNQVRGALAQVANASTHLRRPERIHCVLSP